MGEEYGYLPFPKGYSTDAIHHQQEAEQWNSMAVITPIVTSSTFKQNAPHDFKQFPYSRLGNPTRHVLENVLAKLDNAKYGLAFSSGLGAFTAIVTMFKSGDHCVISSDIYGGTFELFQEFATKFKIEVTEADLTNLDNLKKVIKPNTKLVWVETPTNPNLKVVDIRGVAEICKKQKIIVTVDNTFITSYLQRPLDLGADIVAYSLSKFMNGHSDVVMGAITTSNKEIYDQIKHLQIGLGGVPSPFDCYQVLRSLKTLPLRMQQHMKNSIALAKYLENHPKVAKVQHPGLPSHPQHELVKKQTSGHSGIFSFHLKGGLEESRKFLSSLKLMTLGESLGGIETLIQLPSRMSAIGLPPEKREALNITNSLIRLSTGLEDINDLIADLEQALEKI